MCRFRVQKAVAIHERKGRFFEAPQSKDVVTSHTLTGHDRTGKYFSLKSYLKSRINLEGIQWF